MIRKLAKNGDGFNLDEFCSNDGHFLHKFIYEPRVVIATDCHGNTNGAVICGFSHLSIATGSLYSAYFAVEKNRKKKGNCNSIA